MRSSEHPYPEDKKAQLDFYSYVVSLTPRARLALLVGVVAGLALAATGILQIASRSDAVAAVFAWAGAAGVFYLCARTGHLLSWYRLCVRPSAEVFSLEGYAEVRSVFRPGRGGGRWVPSVRLYSSPGQALDSHAPHKPGGEGDCERALVHDGWKLHRTPGLGPSGALLEVAVDHDDSLCKLPPGSRVRFIGDSNRSLLVTDTSVLWARGSWIAGA